MNDPVDFVALVIALIAMITSIEVANIIGPYASIVVLACAGAALSLSTNGKEMTTHQAVGYVSLRVVLAVSLTVALAELLQKFVPWLNPRYTLIPLAFAFGWIKDYDTVRDWFGRVVDRFVTKRIDDGK